MADQDVIIRISAKNLSKAGFDAARKQLDDLGKKAGLTNTGFGQMGKGFQSAARDLASFNPTAARATSLLSGFGAAGIAAGAGIGALVGGVTLGVRGLVQMGDRLSTLSRQFRLTSEEVQRLEAGGRGLGISIEKLAGESAFLEKTLGGRGKGAVAAMDALGLSYEKLAGMRADERLIAVHGALVKIQDPLKQSALGAELLGRNFEKMTQVNFDEFKRDAESALTLSQRATDAGDALGDSWDKLLANTKVLALEGFAPLAEALNDVVEAMNKLATAKAPQFAARAFFTGIGGALASAEDERIRKLVGDFMRKGDAGRIAGTTGAPPPPELTEAERARLERAQKKAAEEAKKAAEAVTKFTAQMVDDWKQARREAFAIKEIFGKGAFGAFDPLANIPPGTVAPALLPPGLGKSDAEFGRAIAIHAKFSDAAEKADTSLLDLNRSLADLAHLSEILGPELASVFAGLSSGLAGLQSIQSGVGSIKEGGFLNTITGIAGIAAGAGAIAAPIIALIKGLGGPDIGRDVGRDIGANISEELEKAIEESGKNAQLFLREIFAEGGLGIDEFAREVGDLLSMFERGEISETGLLGELSETIPILIQHFRELGPAGEAEIERITAAAERLGVSSQALNDLLQATFAPQTVEEMAAAFGLTNDQIRAMAEELGINVQTNLERVAASVGLTADEFTALGAALQERFGIPAEQLEEFLKGSGESAADLAKKLGVDVGEGAQAAADAQELANQRLGVGVDLAGQLADNLERAAQASGSIGSFGAGQAIPGFQHGGFVPESPHGTIIRVAERGTGGEFMVPAKGGLGGVNMVFTINLAGGGEGVTDAQVDALIRRLRNNMRGAADELAETLRERLG